MWAIWNSCSSEFNSGQMHAGASLILPSDHCVWRCNLLLCITTVNSLRTCCVHVWVCTCVLSIAPFARRFAPSKSEPQVLVSHCRSPGLSPDLGLTFLLPVGLFCSLWHFNKKQRRSSTATVHLCSWEAPGMFTSVKIWTVLSDIVLHEWTVLQVSAQYEQSLYTKPCNREARWSSRVEETNI